MGKMEAEENYRLGCEISIWRDRTRGCTHKNHMLWNMSHRSSSNQKDMGMSNYPMVPGHEVVGEVGSDVSKFTVGDIVGVGCLVGCCGGCSPCERDLEQYCPKKICSYNDVYINGHPTQ